ncbi:hypothetical protein, partial [Candidatus Symbiothrix dinenymphae]|uniref:hypothetical protein n=1 Tax=Candidatus Symbiothrix dinenymphae TaxID=467085 RepID=UPI000A717A39
MKKNQTSLVCFCFSMSTFSAQAAGHDSGDDNFIYFLINHLPDYLLHSAAFWMLFGMLIVGFIGCFVLGLESKKCVSCKKWNAMETKEVTTANNAIKTRTVETKKVATTNVPVPVVCRKCKYCGYGDVK